MSLQRQSAKDMAGHETLLLRAVGDVMLGDHPVCFGHGVRSTIDRLGFDTLFHEVGFHLRGADLVFGNLETVLADADETTLESAEMRGREADAAGLSWLGFNVMSVANNHIMQYGTKAFEKTIKALERNRIAPVGLATEAGSNVRLLELKGIRVAMISFSLRPEKYWKGEPLYARDDGDRVVEQVARLKHDADVIVVSLHWGEEYINHCSLEQVSVAHRVIDAGASLILGHHPHVLQGVEEYHGAFIFYSLGNFIFDRWQRNPRETIIAECRISKRGVEDVRFIPVFIDRLYRPRILNGRAADRLLEKLNRYSLAVKNLTEKSPEKYRRWYGRLAVRAVWRIRIQSYLYFVRNLYRYEPGVIVASLKRFLKRRINPATP